MQSVSIARTSVPGALDWFQLNIMISGAVEIIYISNIDNISDLFQLVVVGRFENSAQKLWWFNQFTIPLKWMSVCII